MGDQRSRVEQAPEGLRGRESIVERIRSRLASEILHHSERIAILERRLERLGLDHQEDSPGSPVHQPQR